MKSRYFVLLFVCLTGNIVSTAQSFNNFSFTRISTAEGLSQGHVSAILKDHKGFMWFATDGGLNKYDGYTFTVYNHNPASANSISNSTVLDIAEDAYQNLWAATGSGIDKFDREKEIFTHYTPGGVVVTNTIFIDSKKRIWTGTRDGLYLFNPATGAFTRYQQLDGCSNCISNNHIYKITEDKQGCLWIGTKDGLNKFNPSTNKFTIYRNNPADKNSIGGNWVRAVYTDSKGNVWAGTLGGGVSVFNSNSNTFTNYLHDALHSNSISYNDILSFAEDSKGNIWIGTENGGISIFNPTTHFFQNIMHKVTDVNSLSNNSIYSLYKDELGNMWVGTWSNGVNYLPVVGKKFANYTEVPGEPNSLNNSIVLCITGDNKNNIWIGTDGGGLNCFNRTTQAFTHYKHLPGNKNSPEDDFIITAIEVGENILALGYHRGGFDLFNTAKGIFTHYALNASDHSRLYEFSGNALYKDRAGNIWIGTWGGGLYKYNREQNKFTIFTKKNADKTSIASDFINCMYQDKRGLLWVGTTAGLDIYDSSTNSFLHHQYNPQDQHSISHNEVLDIYEDRKGRIWIATDGGLDLFDPANQQFIRHNQKDGLPSDNIQSIEEDTNGNLWMGTDNGIASYNPDTKKCTNYDQSDGLQDKEFKPNCSYHAKDGAIFFGGPNGFNVFYPDSMPENKTVPAVFITGLQIFNKLQIPGATGSVIKTAIEETKQIQLSYKESVITFEFAALNYTFPDKNLYAYKLEGFESEWNYVETKREATYTNLAPGNYTFRVKASNNDEVWNEAGTSLEIIITPPFWQTWWFRLLGLFVISGILIGFYLYRINAVERLRKVLEEKVQEQTEELQQINAEEKELRLYAEKAKQEANDANKQLLSKNKELEEFAYIASHDLQEPLRTTTSFVKLIQRKYQGKIDTEADKYLHFITDAADRMKVLIRDLLEFSRIGSNSMPEQIDCNGLLNTLITDLGSAIKNADAVITFGELPVVQGYPTELKQLFQNLIVNAIKFIKEGVPPQITISSQKIATGWQFAVKDNGIGISSEFHDKVFQIFQRLHSTEDFEGTGIGLSYCAKVVALHKGKIWIESEPGKGSTFYFTISSV